MVIHMYIHICQQIEMVEYIQLMAWDLNGNKPLSKHTSTRNKAQQVNINRGHVMSCILGMSS